MLAHDAIVYEPASGSAPPSACSATWSSPSYDDVLADALEPAALQVHERRHPRELLGERQLAPLELVRLDLERQVGDPVPGPRHAGVPGATSAVQNAHRLAGTGISLRHSGHLRVCSSTGVSTFLRAISALTGLTTKKNTAAAMMMNESTALRKCPYANFEPLIVNESVGEVGLAADRGDDRRDDVRDERGDDDAERGADHDRDRQVDEVAAEDECLEFLHHEGPA